MVDSHESQNSTSEVTTVVNQAKKEVKERIQQAERSSNPQQEKGNLAKKIVDQLRSVFTAAQESVQEDQEIARGRRIVQQKTEEKKLVLFALTQAVEAIKAGLSLPISDQGKAFLEGIAKTEQDLTLSTASTIEYYFLDYLTGEKNIIDSQAGQISDQLKNDFEELAATNLVAANLVKRALKEAAKEGRIAGLTPEMVEKDLSIKKTSQKEKEELSLEEEKERQKLYQIIDQKIHEAVKQGKISVDKMNVINKFLFAGELDNELINLAQEIGLSQEVIKRYAELTGKLSHRLDFGIMEQYAPSWVKHVRAAEKDFSLDNLKKYFKRDKNGRLILSRDDRQKIKDMVRRYYYQGLKDIHSQPSESFHKILQEHQDIQYYFIMLRQVIHHSFEEINELLPDIKENEDLKLFFEDLTGNFQARLYGNAQMFHDMPLLTRDMSSVEKLMEFFKYIYPTQLAEVFDDEGLFMVIARDEMVMMLREFLVTRGNQYDGSLLSGDYKREGVRWSQWFKEEYKKKLKGRLRQMVSDDKDQEKYLEENLWKIDMMASYAEGIGIATLVDPEVLSTSDPVTHFRDIHPLMSLLSAKHNWLTGRGFKFTGLINKYLLGLPVTMYPKKRHWLFRLLFKSGWKPDVIKEEIDKNVEFYGERAVDGIYNAGGLYQLLLSMFNLPNSISSWDSWRVEQIPKDFSNFYKKLFGKEIGKGLSQEEWQQVFDIGLGLYGTSFLWWSIKGGSNRLKVDVDARLKKLGFEDSHYFQHKALDRVILSDFDKKKTKMTYVEFEQLKLDQRRADLFFRYLRRNPGDLVMILHQICPEVFELKDEKNHYLLFDERFAPDISDRKVRSTLKEMGKNEDEIRYFLKKRRSFFNQWSGSYNDLVRFHQWFRKVSRSDLFKTKTEYFVQEKGFVRKGEFSKKLFFERFRDVSATAYFRLKRRNEKLRQEILYSDLPLEEKKRRLNQLNAYVTKEDFAGYEEYWQLFAGNNGLFEALTGVKFDQADSFFAKFGGVDSDGEKTIFFNMAHNWNLDKGENNPFAADICYYELFQNFKMAGESTVKRTFEANIVVFKEIISKLGSLEDLLHHASQTGELKEIIELQGKIYKTLSGLVNQEYAWRANYILTQIVAGFFAEHNIPRSPLFHWTGPVGWIVKMFYGQKLSLSKLLTNNRNAYSMDTNALRTYFLILKKANYINEADDGIWGINQLNQVFEATNLEFIAGDVVPNTLWAIALLILWLSIKKGLEELEGKKK